MVVSENALPLIVNDHGVVVAFEEEWFRATLDLAARKAGYRSWWLLDELCLSVCQYLRLDYLPKIIGLSQLERVVRAALRDIGYRDIAARFRAGNPSRSISLATYLGASARRPEAAFFRRLKDGIRNLHAANVRHLHFYDLPLSVARLTSDDLLLPAWSVLLTRARIVDFVRECVGALSWPREMVCTIR